MKRGFTLIEMLGVIAVLAVILLVTFPALSKSLKNTKEATTNSFINNLKVSTEAYIELNRDRYPELKEVGGTTTITIQDLYDANLLKGSNENINSSDQISIVVESDKSLTYYFDGNQIGETKSYLCDNETTFCIASRSDLEKLATEVNNGDSKSGKTYILTKDIDLGGKFDSDGNPLEGNNSWTPIGSSSKVFSGIFDGAGHIITGMYINSSVEHTGLFSYIDGGTIKNLGIENSYVKSSAVRVGSFAGTLSNGSILNCYNKATISGQKTTGGIVGSTSKGIIKNCYNTGDISSNNQQFAAGIVGYESYSSSAVENCYNAGTVTTTRDSGGIAGGTQGQIISCYNIGSIISSGNGGGGIAGSLYGGPKLSENYNIGSSLGGIVGNINTAGSQTHVVTNNYFLNTSATYGIKSTSSNVGASPLSSSDMPTVLSVINGDNAFVSDTKGINNGYPILKWQQ